MLFVVGGLVLIWIGYQLGWRWVGMRWLRIVHFCAIALVAVEALIGVACPLTVLEDALRPGGGGEAGFIGRWVHAVIFWDLPLWVFTALYVAFSTAVALTYRLLPPDKAPGSGR